MDLYCNDDWVTKEHSTGTSIMAVEYNGGVVIGADSRTTTGVYIANRVSDKLTQITDHIYCCRSGSAADTQAISDIVKYHLSFYKAETGEDPLVETAARIFRELCYNYRDTLTAGIIVAGWDKLKGGQVYSIPIGGMCVRMKCTIGGSGSTYIYGFIDENYKVDMNQKECEEFVTKALTLAMHRDGSSGGVVRIGIIDKENPVIRKVFTNKDLPQYQEPN
uniref:Proteasome subunit beta n=1 Tax=Clastoptera arizonana TaxID=38151 RepID=A0A1B6CT04_9HEMI